MNDFDQSDIRRINSQQDVIKADAILSTLASSRNNSELLGAARIEAIKAVNE